MLITAAQAMVKALELEGVTAVFGYPGSAICPFYDQLSFSKINHILVCHEENAGHSASGYARVSGKVGVCVATSGPGAVNLISAIATAYMDSVPLVAITGQVNSKLIGRDVFQEADIIGASESFTKYSYQIKSAEEIPQVFKEAFFLASSGRPGPVLIDIPVDIQKEYLNFTYPQSVSLRGYKPTTKGNQLQIKRVCSAITQSKKPVICSGGGVISSGGSEELNRLATGAGIPVVNTMMGLGSFDMTSPLYMGRIGSTGCHCGNYALKECDLLIIIGARVGDRAISFSENTLVNKTVVHIDIDPAEIGKIIDTDVPLVGDAKTVLKQLLEKQPIADCNNWIQELNAIENSPNPKVEGLNPIEIVSTLCKLVNQDAVISADVGLNQRWSALGYHLKEGRFITSGGMGTMGYSLPAAIGAKVYSPEKQVVAICGDGSFQMFLPEFATIKRHDIDVKLIVMNNGCLGLVRKIQRQEFSKNYTQTNLVGTPNIEKLADAYNINYGCLESTKDISSKLKEMLLSKGAYILECKIDCEVE